MNFIIPTISWSQFTKIIISIFLVQELKKADREYYWTWVLLTILAMIDIMKVLEYFLKHRIQAREILVSDVDDPTDYHNTAE